MASKKKTDLETLIEALPILQKCGVSSVQAGEIAIKFGLAFGRVITEDATHDYTTSDHIDAIAQNWHPNESPAIQNQVQDQEQLTGIKNTDTLITASDTKKDEGVMEDNLDYAHLDE